MGEFYVYRKVLHKFQFFLQGKTIRIFVLFLLTFTWSFFCLRQSEASYTSETGWITGKILDDLTNSPISNAHIEVQARVIDRLPGGDLLLRSLDETIPLGLFSISNDQGQFVVKVPLTSDLNFFLVVVKKEGYQESFDTMVKVEANKMTMIDFELIPLNLTTKDLEILGYKHEYEKKKLYQDNPSYIQKLTDWNYNLSPVDILENLKKQNDTISTQATYPVPNQVYVCNLNGFTGWINLDDFISGVVSAEMGDSFPLEALKAQAVAARSYALEKYNRTGCANGGQAYKSTIGPKSRTAVTSTSKIVILYSGNVISAYYSARCNGDATLNSENGVWNPASCGVGGSYIPYARSRPCSGHLNCSSYPMETPCCYVFTGGRWVHIYGHGVGMCQRGAQDFANAGKPWQWIIMNYYTNVELANTATLPTVTTQPASNITNTTATLNGLVTNDGGTTVIERRFSWGTTSSCSDGCVSDVSGYCPGGILVNGNSFSYVLTNLIPNTTYYFQTWAKNSVGWSSGNILSFTTTSLPSPPILVSPQNGSHQACGINFVWNSVSGATNYELYLRFPNGSSGSDTTTSTSYSYSPGLIGQYYWTLNYEMQISD